MVALFRLKYTTIDGPGPLYTYQSLNKSSALKGLLNARIFSPSIIDYVNNQKRDVHLLKRNDHLIFETPRGWDLTGQWN